jgi:hypothetical protein
MTDEQLGELLRVAIAPVREDEPRPDSWPLVASRVGAAPRWSAVDLGLAAAAAIALTMFPEWFWMIAYHL